MRKNQLQKSVTISRNAKPLNVLSLFDGISCGQHVLRNYLKIKHLNYWASEIEQAPIKNTMHHFPETIQLGDVTKVDPNKLPVIDLLLGGSPCQGFSFSGHGLNFDDPRSKLFFEYVRIYRALRKRNPNLKFLLENVVMSPKNKSVISKYMEVEPVYIDSALFSAQSRKRLYWTNIPLAPLPETEVAICLQDILDPPYYGGAFVERVNPHKSGWKQNRLVSNIFGKSPTITKCKPVCVNIPLSYHTSRTATIHEIERLAGLPDDYTLNCGSFTSRYGSVGNGWECNTIAFILNYFNPKNTKR
jgi:site-specific DNA-cytosine methylase